MREFLKGSNYFNPLHLVGDFATHYNLRIPAQLDVGITHSYSSERLGYITFGIRTGEITDTQRRKLKRDWPLEVPSWQQNCQMSYKDLECSQDCGQWYITITLSHAFTCEVTGETDLGPSEEDLARAELIESLTPDQLAYLVALEVTNLRSRSNIKKTWSCKPAA